MGASLQVPAGCETLFGDDSRLKRDRVAAILGFFLTVKREKRHLVSGCDVLDLCW